MNDPQNVITDRTPTDANLTNVPGFRVVGLPGAFTAWGVNCVQHILTSNSYPTTPVQSDTNYGVCVLFGQGSMIMDTGSVTLERLRTIIFLDGPTRAVQELQSSGYDAIDAVRMLTATLASLAAVLREEGVLLVQRTPTMDLSAMQSAIASHLSIALSGPLEMMPNVAEIDTSASLPPLSGQALTLTRQVLMPLADFVTGVAHAKIVWPLASFYSGDYPNELASPLMDMAGPARTLYYGPYFHLPSGHWRADVQFVVMGSMPDQMLAVDVFSSLELARRPFKLSGDGLFQVSLPFIVDRTEERIEIRVWLLSGALGGLFGLRQVDLHPMEAGRP